MTNCPLKQSHFRSITLFIIRLYFCFTKLFWDASCAAAAVSVFIIRGQESVDSHEGFTQQEAGVEEVAASSSHPTQGSWNNGLGSDSRLSFSVIGQLICFKRQSEAFIFHPVSQNPWDLYFGFWRDQKELKTKPAGLIEPEGMCAGFPQLFLRVEDKAVCFGGFCWVSLWDCVLKLLLSVFFTLVTRNPQDASWVGRYH